jgi:hypothetical protein
MARVRSAAVGEDRGELDCARGGDGAEKVDAAMNRAVAPGLDASGDGARAETEVQELLSRRQPVLRGGQVVDAPFALIDPGRRRYVLDTGYKCDLAFGAPSRSRLSRCAGGLGKAGGAGVGARRRWDVAHRALG